MRKFLSVILSLSIVLSISAVEIPIARGAETNQQQSLQEGLWSYEIYEYDGITGAVITGYNGSASDIYVPSSIGDGSEKLPVLKLGDGLFQDNTAVNSVTLGKGIRVIGENAFSGASGLVCIVTDEELAEIGANAFNGCTSFNSVILYDAITSIGGNAFAGCKNLTIYCNEGTIGYEYAQSNGIAYEILNPSLEPKTVVCDDIVYYISNGEATLLQANKILKHYIVIPATIDGYPVTSIAPGAFKNITAYVNGYPAEWGISLPETITSVGTGAFKSSSVGSINVPNAVREIPQDTFSNCTLLKLQNFPDNLEYIGDYAFAGSNILDLPCIDSIKHIGYRAFQSSKLNTVYYPKIANVLPEAFAGCKDLKEVYIPEGVTNIGDYAFEGCEMLSRVDLPTQLGVCANKINFINCPNLIFYISSEYNETELIYNNVPYFIIKDDEEPLIYTENDIKYYILNDEAILMYCNREKSGDLIIPERVCGYPVTKINDAAFRDCKEIYNVTLPDTISYLGESAFKGCLGLENINIPKNVTQISHMCFCECISLKEIHFSDLLKCIGDYAFRGTGITEITDFANVEQIGYGAFEYSSLEKLVYPAGVDVKRMAFNGCEKLNDLVIQEGVTELPYCVFAGCDSLSKIIIPKTVMSIGKSALPYNAALGVYSNSIGEKYAIENEIPYYDVEKYDNVEIAEKDGWKFFIINGEAEVAGNISNVTDEIPLSVNDYIVTSIRPQAFKQTNISRIILPPTIKSIGESAFSYMPYLETITIPVGVTTIKPHTFDFSTRLSRIILPDTITEIGDGAFTFTSAGLPKNMDRIEKIGNYAFSYSGVGGTVLIPNHVTFGDGVFFACSNIKKVIFEDGCTEITQDMFKECSKLSRVIIPKSVVEIGNDAFLNCHTILCVYKDSYAYDYAIKNNIPFFILPEKNYAEIAYGAEISGKAVYTDGTPVLNSTVDILYDDGTLKESVTTDENGAYSFTYAEVGRYTIRVTDSEGRSGSEQVFVKRKNVFDVFLAGTTDITVKSSWSVSGTVTPQGSACITLTDTDGNIITSVQTDNGEYTISGVPNGSYIIKAETENGSAVREITVFNGDVTGTDISIEQQAASIEGYVEVEDRSLERSRRNWVQITVYNSEGTVAASGKTDENGKYSFSNLPFGSYSIAAEVTEVRPEHKKNYKRAFTLTGYAYITLNEAKLYTVDTIVLTEESDDVAVISGKVTAHGQGQAGEVILTNVFRNEIARCSAGNNGKYSFKNVRDGLYFITAVTKSDGMGFAAVTVKHGTVYGNTNIVVYKGEKITEHEEYMRNIPPCANRDEALAYKDKIMEEKSFYDGLSEKEKKQFSYEYTERLNRLSEYISSCECSANGGDLSQGGMIISADELNSEKPVQLELNIEKREPWTIGDGGIQTDEEFMQQSIEDVKGDKTAAQYYDITLSKNIGGVEKQITDVKKDTDTTGKIRVTIPIPEEYKGHKKYSFVHVHNGIAVTLVDLDDDPDTVTFEIDKFSTFVLTYSDTEDTVEYPAKISYADGKITVTSTEEASVYIASYKDGKLISVNKSDIEANDADSFDFDETNAAFVWDKNFRPLCEKYKLESTGN